MNPFYFLINHTLVLLYKKNARKFSGNLSRADQVQKAKLKEILGANANTVYGKKYHFASIRSVEAYLKQIPAVTYEDLLPYLRRMEMGEHAVLTSEPVRLFEPTSGSSSASKLIPYTNGLKAEFQEGIRPWLYDLYTRFPQIQTGKSYWSITPAASGKRYTPAGIPIGFEEDTGYFGRLEQLLMSFIIVKPKNIERESNMDVFYYKTCLELLKTENLTLISVWNPTFLLLLLDYMEKHAKELTAPLPTKRRSKVTQALADRRFYVIWPRLTVISCWCDAAAEGFFPLLMAMFPHTVIQPKGLLATEGFMTIPWSGAKGGLLSIYSHFFEFQDTDTKKFLPYSKLVKGRSYEILLTTMGGLYRYRIGDIVTVTGYDRKSKAPVLQFAGKGDKVSDLFGEKLNESFVLQILSLYIPSDHFCLMAPEGNQYVLYLERFSKKAADTGENLTPGGQLADILEQKLCQNYHYAYCRKLGQLNPLRICYVSADARKEYLEACVRQGQKLGDIKPAALSPRQGWNRIFTTEE